MPNPGRILAALGRHGPVLLALSLLTGIAAPALAAVAHNLLALSALLLTLGSFLTAGLSPPEKRVSLLLIAATLGWAGLGVPLLIAGALMMARPAADMQAGVLLSVIAPPVGSAAAIAAILGLRPRLALLASILLTGLAPVTMPLLTYGLASGISLDMQYIALRLASIIGAAGLLAAFLLRWPTRTNWLLPDTQAAAGVAVVGLIVVGLATTDSIRSFWRLDAELFLRYVLVAVAMNIAITGIGAGLFAATGFRNAGTVGLIGGNRNVTLAWAAASGTLHSWTEAYVAACVIPILLLPLVIRGVFAIRKELRARTAEIQPPKPSRHD
jgi:ACR3 family arsenite transporter